MWLNIQDALSVCARRYIPVQMIRKYKLVILPLLALAVVVVLTLYSVTPSNPPHQPVETPTRPFHSTLPLPNEPKLIGRETEFLDIMDKLILADLSLVNIVGPPGVGKSALAISIGHEFQRYGKIAYHVDMRNIEDMSELEKRILKLAADESCVSMEQWANSLSHVTLLILDNCDSHMYDHSKSQSLQDMLAICIRQKTRLKVIITNQAVKGLQATLVPLQYLDYESTKGIVKEELNGLVTMSDITKISSWIGGMPLAVKNLKQLLTSRIETCDTKCIMLRLQKDPINLLTESEVRTQDTVRSSIDIAYNQLEREHKECGWILASLKGSFDEKKAEAALSTHHLTAGIHLRCTSGLSKSFLLGHSQMETVDVHDPVCHIHGTNFTSECVHTKSSHKEYEFHRLIREYFLHKCKEDDLYQGCEDMKQKRDAIQKEDTEFNMWTYLKETATKRNYCPDQYVFLECATRWHALHDGLRKRMKPRPTLSEAIDIGVIGTYWGRTDLLKELFKSLDQDTSKYVRSSIYLLERNQEHKPKAKWLAAYVFYNHHSLNITWDQYGCTCPKAQVITPTMIRRAHKIDKVYSEIESNHLAWAARKSFYINLYFCCMNYKEGCHQHWKFWIQGIVSQIATVNIHFNTEHRQQCNKEGLPDKLPNVINGLWHFSYTQNYTEAKKYLTLALEDKHGCPIRDIAIIMVLHMIHTAREEEDLTNEFIRNHFATGKLIDYHLPDFELIYKHIVIPFFHELGKGPTIAQEITEELGKIESNVRQHAHTYECELFYWHHKNSPAEFLCLTL